MTIDANGGLLTFAAVAAKVRAGSQEDEQMKHGLRRASLPPYGFAVDAEQVLRTGCKSCFDLADRGEPVLAAGP